MAAAATGAPTLQQVASGAAAALVRAQPLPTAAAASLRVDLFPGTCCYLALAVGDSSALLLSGNLLAPAGCAHEPAGVHAASRCWAGAAIAARRPMACSLPHGGRNGDCSHLAQHTDLAAAAKRWGAGAFLCLPFHVPAADAAEASASSSPDAGSTAALLLGVETVPAGAALQLPKQQQQQQQQQQQREHVHSLLSLAGSIVQHAAPELRQAAEALALLRPHLTVPAALQLEQLESVREEELEGGDAEEEEEEEEEGGAAAAAAGGGPGDAAASPAAAAGAAVGELEAGSSRQAVTSLPPPQGLQAAGPGWQTAAGPAGNIRMTSGSGARPSSSGAGPSSSNAAPGGSRAAPVGLQGDAPRVPSGTQQQQQQQQQLGGHRQPFLVRLRQVLLLCWLPLREMLALPAARRSLGLDALLRFQGPAAPSTVAFHGEQWGLPGHGQGRSLEDEFAEYHCRILADKMDAAASLLLLGVLILLCKEPASEVRIGHPLFTMVAAMLVLPVLALVPGALRCWYVRHRERLLLLFFLVALTYQQANVNFVSSHFAKTANARSINAGFQWITVDGLLLQMRFCHQLPTLLTCFMLNLGVIPQFCRHFHSEAEPRYCAAVAAWRALLCLLAPLVIIYLLELRVRRGWLLQRQERERQEERQREQLRAEQLERRRRGRRDPAAAWPST